MGAGKSKCDTEPKEESPKMNDRTQAELMVYRNQSMECDTEPKEESPKMNDRAQAELMVYLYQSMEKLICVPSNTVIDELSLNDRRQCDDLMEDTERCLEHAMAIATSIKNEKEQCKTFITEVKTFKDELHVHCDKMGEDMLKQVHDVYLEDIEDINNLRKENEEVLNDISLINDNFKSHPDQPNRLFVSSVFKTLKRLQEQLDSIKDKKQIKRYQFERNVSLERILNTEVKNMYRKEMERERGLGFVEWGLK